MIVYLLGNLTWGMYMPFHFYGLNLILGHFAFNLQVENA